MCEFFENLTLLFGVCHRCWWCLCGRCIGLHVGSERVEDALLFRGMHWWCLQRMWSKSRGELLWIYNNILKIIVNYNYSLKCIQNNLFNYSYFGSCPRSCIQPFCKALKNVYASMTWFEHNLDWFACLGVWVWAYNNMNAWCNKKHKSSISYPESGKRGGPRIVLLFVAVNEIQTTGGRTKIAI